MEATYGYERLFINCKNMRPVRKVKIHHV